MWRKVWWHSLSSPDTRLFLRACNNSGVWGHGHGTGSCSQARASLITVLLFPWSLSFFLVSPWVKLSRLCWHSLLRTPPGPPESDLNIEKQQELDFYSITMQFTVYSSLFLFQFSEKQFTPWPTKTRVKNASKSGKIFCLLFNLFILQKFL